MSTSDLYAVCRSSTQHVAEYRNGHGSAPPIWGVLGTTYLGWSSPNHWPGEGEGAALWALVRDPRVSEHLRLVHAFTFDQAIVRSDEALLSRLAFACQKFGREFKEAKPDYANHWCEIGETLTALKISKRIPYLQGYGLSCTSVSDPWGDWKGGELHDVFDLISLV